MTTILSNSSTRSPTTGTPFPSSSQVDGRQSWGRSTMSRDINSRVYWRTSRSADTLFRHNSLKRSTPQPLKQHPFVNWTSAMAAIVISRKQHTNTRTETILTNTQISTNEPVTIRTVNYGTLIQWQHRTVTVAYMSKFNKVHGIGRPCYQINTRHIAQEKILRKTHNTARRCICVWRNGRLQMRHDDGLTNDPSTAHDSYGRHIRFCYRSTDRWL